MIRTTTPSRTPRIALLLAALVCALLVPSAVAGAEEAITYKHETQQEYEQQLASSQIESVTINKELRSLRIKLKDGTYVLAKYQKGEQPKVKHALEAKGVKVAILTHSAASKEAKSSPKHKLRYIAGGILIVVIVVVGIVLYVDRKRKAERD